VLKSFCISACHCNNCCVLKGKHLEAVLSSAGDYEVWLTTQLLQQEMDDGELLSQVVSEVDNLSQPMPFDS